MSLPALAVSPDVAYERFKNDDISINCAPKMGGSPKLGGDGPSGRASPLSSGGALGRRRARGVGNKSHRATSHLQSYVPFSSLKHRLESADIVRETGHVGLPTNSGTATRIAAHQFASAPTTLRNDTSSPNSQKTQLL